MSAQPLTTPETLPTDPAAIHKNDILAFIYFTKVTGVDNVGRHLRVNDLDRTNPFEVTGDGLVRAALSADYFAREEKVSQSELIDILMVSYNVPFTVCFEKDDQSERILRGRLTGVDHRRGRSYADDLDIVDNGKGNRQRQINHRGLKYLIVRGVKYVAK